MNIIIHYHKELSNTYKCCIFLCISAGILTTNQPIFIDILLKDKVRVNKISSLALKFFTNFINIL